jgi:hypothetical protein
MQKPDEKASSPSGVDLYPGTPKRLETSGASDVVEIVGLTGFQKRQPYLHVGALLHHPDDLGVQVHDASLPRVHSSAPRMSPPPCEAICLGRRRRA